MRSIMIVTALLLCATSGNGQTLTVRQAVSIPLGESSQVRSIAIRDSSVFVLDVGLGRIAKYSLNGALTQTYGKPGTARGEFSSQASAVMIVGGLLTLIDPVLQRITVYDEGGAVAHVRDLSMYQALATAWAAGGANIYFLTPPIPAGYGFDEESSDYIAWSMLPAAASPARSINRLPVAPDMGSFTAGAVRVNLGAAVGVIAGTPDGELLHASSDAYSVVVFDSQGKRAALLERDVPKVAYSAREQAEIRNRADSTNREAYAAASAASGRSDAAIAIEYDVPTFAPMITALLATQDITLVGRNVTRSGTPSTWDVFDAGGVFAGSVELPAQFHTLTASGRNVWGVQTDAGGTKRIVALELARD